ncbi:glycine cleavage system protein H [archaeon]|nr:glycine cleavage system protein H [archaeon]
MEIEGIEFPDDCLYEDSGSYLWAKQEGDNIRVGLTKLGLALAGDIVYIELPGVGDSVTGREPFGVVETVKATAELNSPVNGEVVEVNEGAADDPSSLQDDAWFIVVKSSDVSGLMDAAKAKEYFTAEIERVKGEGLLE